jgi:hypothetical protein
MISFLLKKHNKYLSINSNQFQAFIRETILPNIKHDEAKKHGYFILNETFFCIRLYIFPGRLLRASYTVVNDRKRSRYDRTQENGDCIRPPCTKTVNDRFFLRISPYVSVYDTEIYDRNTITCKPSYFSVYGRLRPCLFDLGYLSTSCTYFFSLPVDYSYVNPLFITTVSSDILGLSILFSWRNTYF